MERRTWKPRADFKALVSTSGLTFHTNNDGSPYWHESAAYSITNELAKSIETSTKELHQLSLLAVEHLLHASNKDKFEVLLIERFAIPQKYHKVLRWSWYHEGDLNVYQRFDLLLDTSGTPKLLEYNADTPTSMLEAGDIQREWSLHHGVQTTNRLRQMLQDRWYHVKKTLPKDTVVHFAYTPSHEEDQRNVEFMASCAAQAGIYPILLTIDTIGFNPSIDSFVDADNMPIRVLWKLYPWEWLFRESFMDDLMRLIMTRQIIVIEPVWKSVLSNKSILPVLWQMFPDHPNLLPTYFTQQELEDKTGNNTFVKKPILGREGAGITIVRKRPSLSIDNAQVNISVEDDDYGKFGHVYQAPCHPEFPKFHEKWTPVIGSWVVGDEPAGISIREDTCLVTKNTSIFTPHYIDDQ